MRPIKGCREHDRQKIVRLSACLQGFITHGVGSVFVSIKKYDGR